MREFLLFPIVRHNPHQPIEGIEAQERAGADETVTAELLAADDAFKQECLLAFLNLAEGADGRQRIADQSSKDGNDRVRLRQFRERFEGRRIEQGSLRIVRDCMVDLSLPSRLNRAGASLTSARTPSQCPLSSPRGNPLSNSSDGEPIMATATAPRKVAPPKVKDRQMLIGGKWVNAASGKTFATQNPATGQTICNVAEGDKADIDLAVKAARKALESGPWPKMSASERGRLLHKLADAIESRIDELAALETLDNGKPLRDS